MLFHDQFPRKYGTGLGSNSQPLDLQSVSHLLPDTLPTATPQCSVNNIFSNEFRAGIRNVSQRNVDNILNNQLDA